MSDTTTQADPIQLGEGWAIAPSIDALGEGGFRRVRPQLNITAFGMNVKVMEPGSSSRNHMHHEQQEVIFVHEGSIKVTFGDATTHEVATGGIIVVDALQSHVVRVTSDEPAVLVLMGGKGGVVEGDGKLLDD